MTPIMGAIVAYLLEIPLSQPAIAEIVVTSDGFVLARAEGEAGANHFIGNYVDLIRNFYGLLAVAGLTTVERGEAECLFAAKIGYFGRTNAWRGDERATEKGSNLWARVHRRAERRHAGF